MDGETLEEINKKLKSRNNSEKEHALDILIKFAKSGVNIRSTIKELIKILKGKNKNLSDKAT